ncbi:class F sortase [Streptomyces corynorhini]|uniref:class F sortase n=1 Tax=Streptomyces corynorhini TaxID=2282652 RepID=UPI0018F48457|nr:class F sortase [Streptomyces corynorhini]
MKTTGHRGIWTAVAATCAMAAALTTGLALADHTAPPPAPTVAGTPPGAPRDQPVTRKARPALPRSVPTRVSIPVLGLAAELQPAALAGRGELPLPDDPARASWLDSSAAPGERGTAVLAGHVDTAHGPAAFYQLSGAAPGPSLRLITCTGWDAKRKTYRDNGVVYAPSTTPHTPAQPSTAQHNTEATETRRPPAGTEGAGAGRSLTHDTDLYEDHNTVERMINQLKAGEVSPPAK